MEQELQPLHLGQIYNKYLLLDILNSALNSKHELLTLLFSLNKFYRAHLTRSYFLICDQSQYETLQVTFESDQSSVVSVSPNQFGFLHSRKRLLDLTISDTLGFTFKVKDMKSFLTSLPRQHHSWTLVKLQLMNCFGWHYDKGSKMGDLKFIQNMKSLKELTLHKINLPFDFSELPESVETLKVFTHKFRPVRNGGVSIYDQD